jgi:hypothetical protein
VADSGNSSGIPIIGPILDILQSLLAPASDVAALANAIGEVERASWTNVLQIATWTFGELGKIWDVLKGIGEAIGLAIYHVIIDYLIPLLKKIIAAIKDIQAKIAKLLKPIVKWIKRIRDWYVKHILPWQKLALQIISAVRQFLELLKLLDVKWAAKLDAELQKIQGYITESITAILGPLNAALSILGMAVDPSLFFRQDMFGRTLWNSLGDVKKAAGYGSARPVYASEQLQEEQMHNAVYGTGPLTTVGPDGSAVYDPALKVVDDSLTKQMQTQGVAP